MTATSSGRTASSLFAIMKFMDSQGIHYFLRRTGAFVTILATMPGKRVEFTVDEDDMIDVAVFKGDESVEIGLDAALKALSEDE